MKRRTFIATSAVAALSARAARGQVPRRATIGWLGTASRELQGHFIAGFVKGMAELGRVEGRDYEIVYRFAEGQLDRLPALAAELVALRPTLILVGSTPGAIAARQATTTVPIIAATFSDPVGFGLAGSEARPGGNVTGQINYVPTLPGKLMSLAIDVKPGARRLGLLLNLTTPQHAIYRRDSSAAATRLGVSLVTAEVRGADDLPGAVDTLRREGVDIVVLLQDSMFLAERARLAALMAAAGLPALYSFREHALDGGLISYGQKLTENYRRVATFVDKVLKGARPGDLPIEFPESFELVLNMKTARALGLDIPLLILAQAEEVIE